MWDFLPREALPDSEAQGDGWVEVTTRNWRTCDDSESDTQGESPTNLEYRPEHWYADGRPDAIRGRQSERSNRRNTLVCQTAGLSLIFSLTREHVEEYAGGFSHHLTQDSRPLVLKVELPL